MKSLNHIFAKAILVLMFSFSAASFVRAQKQVAENTGSNRVLFLGFDEDNRLKVELQLAGLPEKGTVLRILDGDKTVLYEERIDSKTWLRRYRIERSDWNRIYFEVSNPQTFFKERFQLNCRVEEKWEVIKA